MIETFMTSLILLLFVLTSCTQDHLSLDQQKFHNACLASSHGWMYMSEMHNGSVDGPPCYGCMLDSNNHICSLQEYQHITPIEVNS